MIDSHAHLDFCEEATDELVAAAAEAGVERILTIGTGPSSCQVAIEIAGAHETVFAGVGHHPHEAASFDDGVAAGLDELATDDKVRAIGEAGLDFYRDFSPREKQMESFIAQIEIARRHKLPLVVHTRGAEAETMVTLAQHAAGLMVVMHCFSIPAQLESCIERGYYLSFAGNVTYPKSAELQRAASQVPDELILVETDSPYLSPQKVRGRPNRPANVRTTAELIAGLRGQSYEQFEAVVSANGKRAFNW